MVQLLLRNYVPLKLRNHDTEFQNNKLQAMNRLNDLSRKFKWNGKFFTDYRNFIKDMIKKGYVKEFEKPVPVGKNWYSMGCITLINQKILEWYLIVVHSLEGNQSTLNWCWILIWQIKLREYFRTSEKKKCTSWQT